MLTRCAFVGSSPTDESLVYDLPVGRQLFGNPMLCTLLTQRLPYFEVSSDPCRFGRDPNPCERALNKGRYHTLKQNGKEMVLRKRSG